MKWPRPWQSLSLFSLTRLAWRASHCFEYWILSGFAAQWFPSTWERAGSPSMGNWFPEDTITAQYLWDAPLDAPFHAFEMSWLFMNSFGFDVFSNGSLLAIYQCAAVKMTEPTVGWLYYLLTNHDFSEKITSLEVSDMYLMMFDDFSQYLTSNNLYLA